MVQVHQKALDNSISTLVYQIDVQNEINLQVGKFLKNNKRAGQKFSGKSINVQGEMSLNLFL